MISRESAYEQIQALVIRFEEQIDSYRSGDYNETLTRRDFIDPFFKAPGWDIDNSPGEGAICHQKARIGHTDDKINRMVGQLYGLTKEEIQLVENFR